MKGENLNTYIHMWNTMWRHKMKRGQGRGSGAKEH